jgi:hypothetical protein
MVPYQSYWDLPTLSALPLSEIKRDGTIIRFELKLPDETMKFQLQPVSGGVRLVKEGDQYRPEGVLLKVGKSLLK